MKKYIILIILSIISIAASAQRYVGGSKVGSSTRVYYEQQAFASRVKSSTPVGVSTSSSGVYNGELPKAKGQSKFEKDFVKDFNENNFVQVVLETIVKEKLTKKEQKKCAYSICDVEYKLYNVFGSLSDYYNRANVVVRCEGFPTGLSSVTEVKVSTRNYIVKYWSLVDAVCFEVM